MNHVESAKETQIIALHVEKDTTFMELNVSHVIQIVKNVMELETYALNVMKENS